MDAEESKKKHQRVVAWCYFSYALLAVFMAIFAGFIDPQSTSSSGGKSGFYYAIFEIIGMVLEPVFGRYGTSAVFIIVAIGLLLVWRRKLKAANVNEL